MRNPDLKNDRGCCCQIRGQKNFNQKNIILFWSAMKKMIVWWFPFQFFFWFEAAMPWRLKIRGRAIASTIFGRMTSKFHKIILWQWQISFINSFWLLHWFCEILEASLFKDSCVSLAFSIPVKCKKMKFCKTQEQTTYDIHHIFFFKVKFLGCVSSAVRWSL